MNRLAGLVENLPKFLAVASLVEIEMVLRAVAVELSERSMPDTRKLFEVARGLEAYRAGVRAARES